MLLRMKSGYTGCPHPMEDAMQNVIKYFPRFLQIELEDLLDDLECMIRKTEADYQAKRISEHVHHENLALLKNEMMGVRVFSRLLESEDLTPYQQLEDTINHLITAFRESARKHAVAHATLVCIERKMRKVARYMTTR